MWSLLFSYSSVLLALVRNLALVPLYLQFISAREYGAWLATGGILGYLTIADFGLMGVLGQQTAEAYGARDASRLGRVVGTGLWTMAALSGIAALLASGVAPALPWLLGLETGIGRRLVSCFVIVAISSGLSLFSMAANGVLRSFQRPALPGAVQLCTEILSIVVTIVCLLRGWGLYAIAAGFVARDVLAAGCSLGACLWYCRAVLGLRLKYERSEVRSLFTLSGYHFLAAVSNKLQVNLDPLVIGAMLGPEAAGAFVLTVRAHETVRMLSSQLNTALKPSLAHLYGEGKTTLFGRVVFTTLSIQAFTTAIGMGGVIAFNERFVSLWVGHHFFAGQAVNTLYAVWCLASLLCGVLYDALFAMAEFSRLCRITWVMTAVRTPLLLGLLCFGSWGAPLAAVIAQIPWMLVPLAKSFVQRLAMPATRLRAAWIEIGRLAALPIIGGCAVLGFGRVPENWLTFGVWASVFTVMCIAGVALVNPKLALAVIERKGRLPRY